jgi:hypothetical protein
MSTAMEAPSRGRRRSLFRRMTSGLSPLNSLAPILTILVAAITFVGGIVINVISSNHSAQESQREQWRQALEKVSFDESNILQSAFLMESFAADPHYNDGARAIEAEALTRTNVPATFDLVFSTMLQHVSNRDQAHIVRAASALSIELRELYSKAPQGVDFKTFLMHPDAVYSLESTSYRRTLVILWEIDSISEGFQCSWETSNDCPPDYPKGLSPSGLDLHEVLIFNHPLPPSILVQIPPANRPIYYSTCTVENVNVEPGKPSLTCHALPGA